MEKDQMEILNEKFGVLSRAYEKVRKSIKDNEIPKSDIDEMNSNFSELEFWLERCKMAHNSDREALTSIQRSREVIVESNIRLKEILKKSPLPQPIPQVVITSPDDIKTEETPAEASASIPQKGNEVPALVPHLTMEEFVTVPSYMKGRLTLGKVNHFINEFNKTIATKYKLLKTPRSQLSAASMIKVHLFKSQMCDEVYGHNFCTDDDLKEFSNVKIDRSAKNCLMIMRHCGRMRDVRSGSFVFHAIHK